MYRAKGKYVNRRWVPNKDPVHGFVAQYPGICQRCGHDFFAGELIRHSKVEGHYSHVLDKCPRVKVRVVPCMLTGAPLVIEVTDSGDLLIYSREINPEIAVRVSKLALEGLDLRIHEYYD